MTNTDAPTLEPHEAGTSVLDQAFRRLAIPAFIFLMAVMGIGFASGRGGLVGVIIDGFVAAAFLGLILLGRTPLFDVDTWLRGWFGEVMVAHLLGLLPPGFHVLHDITVASNGKKRNIDHVVVGPTGVWAIETKNRRAIFGRREDVLLVGGNPDDHGVLRQAISGAMDIRGCLQRAGITPPWINALVVSTTTGITDGQMEFPRVRVIGASDLVPRVRGGKHMLDGRRVREIVAALDGHAA